MIYLRDLIASVDRPHTWMQQGSKFIITPFGIGGVFQKGAVMMPEFREAE